MTLDASAGYWQIEMLENANDKTDFVTNHGQSWSKQMLYALKNASATSKRATGNILLTMEREYALVYSGNVVVFLQTLSQHIEQIATVLWLIKSPGLTLELTK